MAHRLCSGHSPEVHEINAKNLPTALKEAGRWLERVEGTPWVHSVTIDWETGTGVSVLIVADTGLEVVTV